MEKYICKYCHEVLEFNNYDDPEQTLWGHIQMEHPEIFSDVQDMETTYMLEECYEDNTTPIYVEDEAAAIVELFDDLLVDNGIKIQSPDDDQRGDDNEAALYGETYSMLTDKIAKRLAELIIKAKIGSEVIEGELSGNIHWL